MAWFCRLSPDGEHWVGEVRGTIIFDGQTTLGEGIQPCWLAGTPIWAHGSKVFTPEGIVTCAYPINRLETCGTDRWVAWHAAAQGYTFSWYGVFTPSLVRPVPDASISGLFFPPTGCIEPRTEAGRVSIRSRVGTAGPFCEPSTWAPWKPVTHLAVPVPHPDGVWVLRLEDTRLALHPIGDWLGMVVATGITHTPDCRWRASRGAFRVLWTDAQGRTQETHIPLTHPRVDLRKPSVPPQEPPMPPIDLTPILDRLRALEGRVGALEGTVVAHEADLTRLTVKLDDLEDTALKDHDTVALQVDRGLGYVSARLDKPNTPMEMAQGPHAWEKFRVTREWPEWYPDDEHEPDEGEPPAEPQRFPETVGITWPLPETTPVYLSEQWLQQFAEHGFTSVRFECPLERAVSNTVEMIQRIQGAGLDCLPLFTWLEDTEGRLLEEALAAILGEVGHTLRWVEIGNEPWILHKIPGDRFLATADSLVQIAERLTPFEADVIIACDLFDHNTGKRRPWPGAEEVIAYIAQSERRWAAIHPYRNPRSPNWSPWGGRVDEEMAIHDALGHERYYITEVGWKPQEGTGQADGSFHIRELEIAAELRHKAVWLYTHINDPGEGGRFDFGLFEHHPEQNTISPRPSAVAIKAALVPDVPEPPEEPPTGPDPATALRIRMDFLGRWNHGDGPLFMIGGMEPALRQRQYAWMRERGWTHIPLAVHNDYPAFPQWHHDWWDTLAQLVERLWEHHDEGFHTILVLHPLPNTAMAGHLDRVSQLWKAIHAPISAVQWGWEINDLGGQWANGSAQLDYLAGLRGIVGGVPILVHFTPEQWSGWPSFDGTEQQKDEVDWLRRASSHGVVGLLYQDRPTKPLDAVMERALRIPSPHGWSPGICGRVVDGAGLRFYLYEFSRDEARHREGQRVLDADPRVSGLG